MEKAFDAEKARQLTITSIRQTATVMHVNRAMLVQVLCDHFGAPDERSASGMLDLFMSLLKTMDDQMESATVLDAATLMPGDGEARVH